MKKFRILSFVLIVLLAASLFTACNSGRTVDNVKGSSQNHNQSAEQPKKKVTLQFAWWGDDVRHNGTLAAVEVWNENNLDIQVEAYFQGFDGYHTKLVTQFAGKSAPDIFQLSYDAVETFATRSQLLDLTPYMNKYFSGIDQALRAYNVVDGKNYAMPSAINAGILLYNKTKLDKFGIRVPTDNETLDSLLELCKLATRDTDGDGKIDTWGINNMVWMGGGGALGDFIRPLMHQYGIDAFKEDMTSSNFDHPDLVELYTKLNKFRDAGICPEPGEITTQEGGNDFTSGYTVFSKGFLSAYSNTVESMDDEIGCVAFPVVGGKPDTRHVVQGLPIAVSNDSKYQEESVQFLSWFLSNPDAARVMGMVRGIFPSKTQRDIFKETTDNSLKEMARVANFYDSIGAEIKVSSNPSNFDEWLTFYGDMVDEYLYRQIDLDEMLHKIKTEGDEILKQE